MVHASRTIIVNVTLAMEVPIVKNFDVATIIKTKGECVRGGERVLHQIRAHVPHLQIGVALCVKFPNVMALLPQTPAFAIREAHVIHPTLARATMPIPLLDLELRELIVNQGIVTRFSRPMVPYAVGKAHVHTIPPIASTNASALLDTKTEQLECVN